MKRLSSVAFVGIILLIIITGCSVKENRGVCPCYLVMDLSEVDTDIIDSLKINVLSAGDFFYSASLLSDDFRNEQVVEVPRGRVLVNVSNSYDQWNSPSSGIVIPLGKNCPELYMYSSDLNTNKDMCRDTVRLCKSYCKMMITMLSDKAQSTFDIGVGGSVDGYNPQGSPRSGDFYVKARPNEDGKCEVLVPRQIDGSLVLEIVDDGKVLRRFALGEYMLENEYDWNVPNLTDVEVVIDFSKAEVSLQVDDWDKSYFYEVEI